ncbi:hypothetical protein GCM10009530_72390 [Microbispora corallina]|uniref:Uncharacterized protein n=1 Tax=Microbispora corallina TaxID=83302 RepID=A0ABQ4G4K8_9ACTN|nr:hypothetical protein [Microbispora corallina]GIH41913.1 hypothetical protein Mco01_49130 [Microbispora corallina]
MALPHDDQGPSRAALLRQAEDKERLATRFDGWAKDLDGLLAQVTVTSGGRDVWTGPAADRFSGGVRERRAETAALAGDCRTAAANLRGSAARLREDAKKAPA